MHGDTWVIIKVPLWSSELRSSTMPNPFHEGERPSSAGISRTVSFFSFSCSFGVHSFVYLTTIC
jgi:hypothetical protein